MLACQLTFICLIIGLSSTEKGFTMQTSDPHSSVPKVPVAKILAAILGLTVLICAVRFGFNLGYNEGYAPVQPIPFRHKQHAGLYRIPCMYCHTNVEKSRHATVPPTQICMNCHSVVAPGSPYIQKMKELYSAGKSFEWVKVHDLPDHVYFPHNRHVNRGVQCESCHGDVKRMDRVTQASNLSMGWCIDCHRGKTTPDYLFSPSEQRGPVAPVNCNTCHK